MKKTETKAGIETERQKKTEKGKEKSHKCYPRNYTLSEQGNNNPDWVALILTGFLTFHGCSKATSKGTTIVGCFHSDTLLNETC